MRKVKGIVLKSEPNSVYLLTPGGNYLKLPGRGQVYETGREIEIDYPRPAGFSRYMAAAAILIVFALSLVLYVTAPRHTAYLAMDINPGLLISLDQHARVLTANGLNVDGKELLQDLNLDGMRAEAATAAIFEQAYRTGYLKAGIENSIFIALAAPDDYPVNADELRMTASAKIASLDIGSYVKVQTMTMERASEAVKNNLSINSIALQDELKKRGVWKDSFGLEEEPGLAPPVGVIQKKAGSAVIFREGEFIAGDKTTGGPPDHSGPPEKAPGPEQQEPQKQQQNQEADPPGATEAQQNSDSGNANDSNRRRDNDQPGRYNRNY